jgi:ABC-type multidrug transport system permease subunit
MTVKLSPIIVVLFVIALMSLIWGIILTNSVNMFIHERGPYTLSLSEYFSRGILFLYFGIITSLPILVAYAVVHILIKAKREENNKKDE